LTEWRHIHATGCNRRQPLVTLNAPNSTRSVPSSGNGKLVEVDHDLRQGVESNRATGQDGFFVGAIGLQSRHQQLVFERVKAPDFFVAACLVIRNRRIDVVTTGGR
jgi:hypothetical protein